ncbi:MAG: PorT family protein, partial [Duncaniella sp.]|nr:PorT family protein [Duncaniella sp.]
PKVGFDLDFGFTKPIAKSGAYWGMDLGVVTRGGVGKYTEEYRGEVETEKQTLSTWALKFTPITFGYRYSITDDIKLDGHLGAYALYDFSQKISGDGTDDTDKDEVFENKYDIGIQVGIGGWWKNFNLDFSYQHGFVDFIHCTDKYDDAKYLKSSAFVIRLGYAF